MRGGVRLRDLHRVGVGEVVRRSAQVSGGHSRAAKARADRIVVISRAVERERRQFTAAARRASRVGLRCESCREVFAWIRGPEFFGAPQASGVRLYQAARDHVRRLTCDGPVVIVQQTSQGAGETQVEGAIYVRGESEGDPSNPAGNPTSDPSTTVETA